MQMFKTLLFVPLRPFLDNIVDLVAIIENNKNKQDKRALDLAASFSSLNVCLLYLNMNDLPETNEIKKAIGKVLKELKKLK